MRSAVVDTVACSEIDYPLEGGEIDLRLDFVPDDLPEVAQRRFGALLLRQFADRLEAGKAEFVELEEGESAPGEIDATAEAWRVPADVHMKSAKAGHRFLVAAASLLEKGPAPTLAEIADKAGLSMPPVYRFVDLENETGAYLAPLMTVTKRGRAKVVDLTILGRKVTSRIRAGSLPS